MPADYHVHDDDQCLTSAERAGEHNDLQDQLTKTQGQLEQVQQSAHEQEAHHAEAQAQLEQKVPDAQCTATWRR